MMTSKFPDVNSVSEEKMRASFEECVKETECLLMVDEETAFDIFRYAYKAALQESVTAKDLLIASLTEKCALLLSMHKKADDLLSKGLDSKALVQIRLNSVSAGAVKSLSKSRIVELTQQLAAANGRLEKYREALEIAYDHLLVHWTEEQLKTVVPLHKIPAALSDLSYEVPSFDERSSEDDKEKS